MLQPHEFYMQKALSEAKRALSEDEVPVGSIIVYNNKIIAKSFNMCVKLCDPTAHAEMQVITAASNYLNSRYLEKCIMYTTLEPCHMCSGALYWAKIGQIVYGASDKKNGFSLMKEHLIHPKTIVIKGVLENECSYLLTDFFKKKRKFKSKK